MKKNVLVIIIIVAVIVIVGLWVKSAYNGFVEKDEAVSTAWSQVENVYQRRSDLIPNLVATVKGYAAHEAGTLEAVVNARARATQVTLDPTDLDPEDIAEYQKAQGELSGAIGRLLVSVEQYPDLKANENFLALQAELEGTENRIAVERKKFNEVSREYNVSIRRFPANIVASIFDFEKKGYFTAEEGAEKAPDVSFE